MHANPPRTPPQSQARNRTPPFFLGKKKIFSVMERCALPPALRPLALLQIYNI